MFLERDNFESVYSDIRLKILTSGLNAVDVFFILTGFLLAYPIFTGKRTGSWTKFVWLRVSRVYPVYIASLVFFCGILQWGGTLPYLTWDKHPSLGLREVIRSVHNVDTDGVPHNCALAPFNLLFLNNLVPFGGCMGWTWSLCVQVAFYMIFPLVIRVFGTGRRLAYFMGASTLVMVLQRYLLYSRVMLQYGTPDLYLFSADSLEQFFMFFNVWYSSTPQRIGVIFAGVAVAWAHVYAPQVADTLRRSRLYSTCFVLSLLPGLVISFYSDFASVWHNVLFSVGGLIWLYSISGAMFALINAVGPFAPLQRVLAHPLLGWLAVPTYPVYLMHSIVTVRLMAAGWIQPIYPFSWSALAHSCAMVLLVSYAYGVAVHNLVERPVKSWLRNRSLPAPASADDDLKVAQLSNIQSREKVNNPAPSLQAEESILTKRK